MSLSGVMERLVAGRWLAGANVSDAIAMAKRFNKYGITASINYLGEDLRDRAEIESTVKVYLRLISEIKRNKIGASIAVKPTQLGMALDAKMAARNYARIVNAARRNGIFTWLDMEEHRYVDATIRLYKSQVGKGMAGICVQSYLRRSMEDAERIVGMGGAIRLVKGAYSESRKIAYTSRDETTRNYVRIMEYLFKHSGRFMIATHDQGIIAQAMELNRSYRREVTYAMLSGIKNKALVRLAATGNKVAAYVPFGEKWVDYAFRRLREESHILLVMKSLFQNQRI